MVGDLIPKDRLGRFKEFKGCELYGGYGVFDGLRQQDRFQTITNLLHLVRDNHMPLVYGAVDLGKLKSGLYGSASPLDTAFRICTAGIEECLAKIDSHQFAIVISDDFQAKKIKDGLLESFRGLRKQVRPPDFGIGKSPNTSWHLHDEMYFGDSRQSIGLQMADLCCFFIGKHLEGGDVVAESFYRIIENQIIVSAVVPE